MRAFALDAEGGLGGVGGADLALGDMFDRVPEASEELRRAFGEFLQGVDGILDRGGHALQFLAARGEEGFAEFLGLVHGAERGHGADFPLAVGQKLGAGEHLASGGSVERVGHVPSVGFGPRSHASGGAVAQIPGQERRGFDGTGNLVGRCRVGRHAFRLHRAESGNQADSGPLQQAEPANDAGARHMPPWSYCWTLVTASITRSRLKLPGFWRGGYSLKLCNHWPT